MPRDTSRANGRMDLDRTRTVVMTKVDRLAPDDEQCFVVVPDDTVEGSERRGR